MANRAYRAFMSFMQTDEISTIVHIRLSLASPIFYVVSFAHLLIRIWLLINTFA